MAMRSVGYSAGTGDFQFTGPVYDKLVAVAAEALGDRPTQRHGQWGGTSFRNRREVVQRGLLELGLDGRRLRAHGVQRELFVGFTATNSEAFLRGETATLDRLPHNTATDLARWWKTRWAEPRSNRTEAWSTFDPADWQLFATNSDS